MTSNTIHSSQGPGAQAETSELVKSQPAGLELTTKDIARFWSKVRKTPSCWIWDGRLHNGYGQLKINGTQRSAHRVSFEIANRAPPTGQFVCHRCDNPVCVNPAHLFLGTHVENMADMVRKGRSCKGEDAASASLKQEDVQEIYRLLMAGVVHREIAARYRINTSTVTHIATRRTWKHLPVPAGFAARPGAKPRRRANNSRAEAA